MTLSLGVLIGLAFGYALQRGRFCVNSAFRDALLIRDGTLLGTWALAVAIQLLGLQLLLASTELFIPDVPPLWPAANALGGFVFGMGMVLAGGCASGTCYRAGEGMLGSLLALLGFGLMTVIVDVGALRPLQELVRRPLVMSKEPTLPALLGVPAWALALGLSLPVLAWALWSAWRVRGRAPYQRGWPWLFTGLALGLIGITAWVSSAAAGRAYGLSITGPIRSWFRYLMTGDAGLLDWGSWMLLGLIAGALIAAKLYGEAKLRLPPPGRTLQALGGGILMGLGAQLAGGCNIGHGFTGLAILSLGSLLTTVFIVLGAWAMSSLLFMEGFAKLNARLAKLLRGGIRVRSQTRRQPRTPIQEEGSR
jgi:uncharacterized membrane protein YedE/YeeE